MSAEISRQLSEAEGKMAQNLKSDMSSELKAIREELMTAVTTKLDSQA